jgi:hypothetical protein
MGTRYIVENIALLAAAVVLILNDYPWWAFLCFVCMNSPGKASK